MRLSSSGASGGRPTGRDSHAHHRAKPRTVHEWEDAALVRGDPKRSFLPAYIAARGWVGVRLDGKRVDWKDVARRVEASYRSVAPKRRLSEA